MHDGVNDKSGKVVWFTEFSGYAEQELHHGFAYDEKSPTDLKTHESWIWDMPKFRPYLQDIDGFSWNTESLTNFFDKLLNQSDLESHALAISIFHDFWSMFSHASVRDDVPYQSNWLENYDGYFKSFLSRDLNFFDKLISEIYRPGDISLSYIYQHIFASVHAMRMHEKLKSHTSIILDQQKWNLLEWAEPFRHGIMGTTSLLLAMIHSYEISSAIVRYGLPFGFQRPTKPTNVVGEQLPHLEDSVFSNMFIEKTVQHHVESGHPVWIKPARIDTTMEEIRETFLFGIDVIYEIEHPWFNDEDRNIRMLDWVEEFFAGLECVLDKMNRSGEDDFIYKKLDIFPQIWSQAVMIGQTALQKNSTGGMIVCLSMINSLNIARERGLEINDRNIRVRYEKSFSPWVEIRGYVVGDYTRDFLLKSEQLYEELTTRLDEIENGLGTEIIEKSSGLFDLDWIEKHQKRIK